MSITAATDTAPWTPPRHRYLSSIGIPHSPPPSNSIPRRSISRVLLVCRFTNRSSRRPAESPNRRPAPLLVDFVAQREIFWGGVFSKAVSAIATTTKNRNVHQSVVPPVFPRRSTFCALAESQSHHRTLPRRTRVERNQHIRHLYRKTSPPPAGRLVDTSTPFGARLVSSLPLLAQRPCPLLTLPDSFVLGNLQMSPVRSSWPAAFVCGPEIKRDTTTPVRRVCADAILLPPFLSLPAPDTALYRTLG